MIDDLAIWKSTFAALPRVADNSWASNFAAWCDDRVTNKAELTGITNPNPNIFIFAKSVFQTALEALSVTPDPVTGITNFALAWETAILASVNLGIVAGAFVGIPSPPTTWSVVNSAIVDAPSIVAGKVIILTLISSPFVDDVDDSEFPEKFRNAFLALTGTVDGLDSVVPPLGPQPLIESAKPFK